MTNKIPVSSEGLCRSIALVTQKEHTHDERKKRKGKENRFNHPHHKHLRQFFRRPWRSRAVAGRSRSCTVSQVTSGDPDLTFPFTPAQGSNGSYSMSLPTLATIGIGSTPGAGTYYFNASCCSTRGSRALRELPLTPAVHPRARGFQSKPSARLLPFVVCVPLW